MTLPVRSVSVPEMLGTPDRVAIGRFRRSPSGRPVTLRRPAAPGVRARRLTARRAVAVTPGAPAAHAATLAGSRSRTRGPAPCPSPRPPRPCCRAPCPSCSTRRSPRRGSAVPGGAHVDRTRGLDDDGGVRGRRSRTPRRAWRRPSRRAPGSSSRARRARASRRRCSRRARANVVLVPLDVRMTRGHHRPHRGPHGARRRSCSGSGSTVEPVDDPAAGRRCRSSTSTTSSTRPRRRPSPALAARTPARPRASRSRSCARRAPPGTPRASP